MLTSAKSLPFIKMDGTGNTFVVIDTRKVTLPYLLTPERVKAICGKGNPETGGCDQLILLEVSHRADIFMRIYNADGGEVDACGNATRCVAWLMASDRLPADDFFDTGVRDAESVAKNLPVKVSVETNAGVLSAEVYGSQRVRVDMGKPSGFWKDIPLSEERDTLHLNLQQGPLSDAVAVSMGNPHAVFFVNDIHKIDLKTIGPALEHDPLFPQRANIGVASIRDKDIYLRVWERGAGETKACGTGACAAYVAALRRGYLSDLGATNVYVEGGKLLLMRPKHNEHIVMEGAVHKLFESGMLL